MTASPPQRLRVGTLRPNQLLHTYGVGAMADLPNLSVMVMGLERWELNHAHPIEEERLLAAVRTRLGNQVTSLRLPPYLVETSDPFGDWAREGVPVGLFPTWLRCSMPNCGRLAPATSGLFDRLDHSFQPDKIRFVHKCYGNGANRPVAVPARFVLACENGHLDDFPWVFYVHRAAVPDGGHQLKMTEHGSTGEAADVMIHCGCDQSSARSMSEAFGEGSEYMLPVCRGRHPHLGTFSACGLPTRTLVLGATNSWFPMQLRAITIPRNRFPIRHLVAEFWPRLQLLASLPEDVAKSLLPTQTGWHELEPFGVDAVWEAMRSHVSAAQADSSDEMDLHTPEWKAFTDRRDVDVQDFTTRDEPVPPETEAWMDRVVLVPRLREVAALYGFTRIDAPEWEVADTPDTRRVPLGTREPTWVPCAEMRGEGIFLELKEDRVAAWERQTAAVLRGREVLEPAHRSWRAQRRLDADGWPGLRYILLHTLSHALIREFALESGYSAAGIGERIYARDGSEKMAGILLYTAAPDSEGTLGGLVSLGRRERLGGLIERALQSAMRCSSDPLCAEHDPRVHGRLYGAACHACLFAAETSCERGNQYLDRALLVETLAPGAAGFFIP